MTTGRCNRSQGRSKRWTPKRLLATTVCVAGKSDWDSSIACARSRCMGRSRGGLTTKIQALVDACGLPIALSFLGRTGWTTH
jgi:hypothetical protein